MQDGRIQKRTGLKIKGIWMSKKVARLENAEKNIQKVGK